MKLLIFGGTTEGRLLSQRALELGAEVTVSVATGLGAEELKDLGGISVLTGRLEQADMESLLRGFDMCVDATHPYAASVTPAIRAACAETGTPLHRLLRPVSRTEGAVCVSDSAAAAEFLKGKSGNVLLATGAKELRAFLQLDKKRLFVRILPTHEGLSACEELGIPHRNILAMQGPFSQKLNEAILEQYHIAWLVTKDGGPAGGFDEKLAAAENTGAQLVLIERPADEGEDMEAILAHIRKGLL